MRISVSARKPSEAAGDCLVCLCEPGKRISDPKGKAAEKALAEYGRAVKAGRMKRVAAAAGLAGAKTRALALAGVAIGGRTRLLRCERVRFAAHDVYTHCRKGGERRAVFLLNGPDGAELAPWVAEGLELGAYSFTRYKRKADSFPSQFSAELVVAPERLAEAKKKVQLAVERSQSANLARDLINEGGSVATPAYIAETAAEVARAAGLECEIWDEKRLKEEGYSGLLAVGRAAEAAPRMVVLRHRPPSAAEARHLCLVGKGITFDTGGLNIKTAATGKAMWEEIGDMSGAAAVLGAMKAIGLSKLKIKVTGILVCAPNLVGSRAILPGDCFVAKNGKSIHVENTDAEGRLILTDGFARAGEEGATHLVDVATLTAACERALGDSLTGLFANDQTLADRLRSLGEETGEEMWQLPLYAPYHEEIETWRADVANSSKSPNARALTAALFLQEFLPRGVAWAHLDIAGTSFDLKRYRYYAAGGRGVMVRTLARLAEMMAAE